MPPDYLDITRVDKEQNTDMKNTDIILIQATTDSSEPPSYSDVLRFTSFKPWSIYSHLKLLLNFNKDSNKNLIIDPLIYFLFCSYNFPHFKYDKFLLLINLC